MILHWYNFSDLHFQFDNYDTNNMRSKLLEFLPSLAMGDAFLLISGDCFFKGSYSEDLKDYIHSLLSICSSNNRTSLYITPGNHDVGRSGMRDHILKYYTGINAQSGVNEKIYQDLDSQPYTALISPPDFENFSKLYLNAAGKSFSGVPYVYEGETYRILNLNTCILAGTDYDEGNLSICDKILLSECKKIKNDNKLNIALMHHGVDFLRFEERKKFQQLMEDSYIDMVFCGHSHKIGLQLYTETKKLIPQFTCGAPIADNFSEPSFYKCSFDTITNEVCCYLYAYSTEINNWHLAKETKRNFDGGLYKWEIDRLVEKKQNPNETKILNATDSSKFVEESSFFRNFDMFGIRNALTLSEFETQRYNLLKNAEGEIIIAGQSLENLFDIREDRQSIVKVLKTNKKIKNIDIFLSDPVMFDSIVEDSGDTPINRIAGTMHTILHNIAKELSCNQSINIYFLPLIQLDHMVFANNFLMLRHTLLWTNDSRYKATPIICEKVDKGSSQDNSIIQLSMYEVYYEYIKKIKSDSIEINVEERYPSVETLGNKSHLKWRQRVSELRKSSIMKGTISLHKLYRHQLVSDLHSSWDPKFRSFSIEPNWPDLSIHSILEKNKSKTIQCPNDLFNPENLLNDPTQKILLPYIKETENLLECLMKKYDKEGVARIFPSLDIGMPNNILRLAGGFATGMLVAWKCGTPIVPVDATVNVCSSSYYEFDPASLNCSIDRFFNIEKIRELIRHGAEKEGIALSFSTGNHFLLLCKSRLTGMLTLVLHSSARQFKDTYLGLYPKPNNWFSKYVKTFKLPDSNRYINYLKDAEAIRFINLAKSLNEQNRDIHNWFASTFCEHIHFTNKKTFHHYGMPTDSSIAIGTYVRDNNDPLPIFSREGFPICLFKPDSEMWKVELGGKMKYIIPHGWGQSINPDYLIKHAININKINLAIRNSKFALVDCDTDAVVEEFNISSDGRFPSHMLRIRELINQNLNLSAQDFSKIGSNYLMGEIVDVWDPLAVFCKDSDSRNFLGKVTYY